MDWSGVQRSAVKWSGVEWMVLAPRVEGLGADEEQGEASSTVIGQPLFAHSAAMRARATAPCERQQRAGAPEGSTGVATLLRTSISHRMMAEAVRNAEAPPARSP